jgi:hypothetical protein
VLDVPSDSDRSDIARAPFLTLPLGRHIQGNASFPVHHIFYGPQGDSIACKRCLHMFLSRSSHLFRGS